ncbi:MAG: Ig-like domain-containing protein [Clostridia bacterium]|nr:Ig-like domain-containing protein [Clostridia bacterium]
MKKSNGRKGWLSRIVACFMLGATLVAGICTAAVASGTVQTVGEMVDIKADFASYLVQDTVRVEDNAYVGAMQYTVYHNKTSTIKTGYEGTPVIIYTVNHPSITRVGTDSNKEIITSMLERGYVVIVLDFLNNSSISSTTLANCLQAFRQDIVNKKVLTYSGFPSGNPRETFVVPSGANVLLHQVFWSIDEHAVDGTLEKIVENWNTDLRTAKGGRIVKWVYSDGTRKKTLDGAVWGDLKIGSDGKETLDTSVADGQYTYIKHTVAQTITDCVDPDGSFIDMDIYINIVYHTSPAKEVPVMSLANSSGYPTTSVTGADLRPHSNDFLYRGYNNVVFDYLWQPMARNASWGYYDGSQGNTKDHMNYGLMMYNDKLVNTAAMRYLRYISLSDTTGKYNFDLDAFGVYGNSKGGWFSYLGEANLQKELVEPTLYSTVEELETAIDLKLASLVPDRYLDGHDGTTRYQAKKGAISVDGITLSEGKKQPWLTVNGKEIISGVQFTNACNGSQEEDVTAGHSPIFISGNMADDYNAAYGYSVNIYNSCRELNIPLLHFEVPIGHTLTSGMDMNYNVDTYENYFRYIAYFLKNGPISVAYASPMHNAGGVDVGSKIEIHFAGVAELQEVQRITVTAGTTAVSGVWESSFGGTVWTFTPDELIGSTEYTLTVPADFKGKNGVAMGEVYSHTFKTERDSATKLNAQGDYYTFTAPESFSFGNSYVFRFLVSNDAANVAELYAVAGTSDTDGTLLGSVNLRGVGSYEIDITDYIAENAGEAVTLLLKAKNTAGEFTVIDSEDGSAIYDNASKNGKVTFNNGVSVDNQTAVSVYVETPTPKPSADNPLSVYYDNTTHLFTYANVLGGFKTTPENIGRRFTIEFDIYDTTDRVLKVMLNSMTKRVDYGTIDYNQTYFHVRTRANAWTHVEFTYEVYEPDYGHAIANKSNGALNSQSLAVYLSPSGKEADGVKRLAYINGLKVTESVTEINVKSAHLAECVKGGYDYKAPASDKPFAVYNGESKVGEYATLAEAFGAYASGYTVRLQSNVTLTDTYSGMGGFGEVNIDLNGYTVYMNNAEGALLWLKATDTVATTVNLYGGEVFIGRGALISYDGSTSSGKNYEVNLDNVYIGVMKGSFATEIVSAVTLPSGASVKANINLNECVIDIQDKDRAKDAAVIFANSQSSALKLNYTVTGGEIRLSSTRWVSILDNAKIVEFFKGEGDRHTSLVMPASITKTVGGSYLIEDGYARYEKSSTQDYFSTYSFVCDANSTRYGVITEDYADADKYPFLMFKNGVLTGGYDTLVKAVNAASALLKGEAYADEQIEILMRRDFVNAGEVNFNTSNGNILIDLGGKTLTRSTIIVNAVVNSSTVFTYPTSVTFTNGRINAIKSGGNFGATHVLTETESIKTFNITFDKVTLGFGSDYPAATNASSVFWAMWQNGYGTKTVTNLTLKDCRLDLETNAPTGGGKLFSFSNTTNGTVHFRMLGGEIVSNGAAYSFTTVDSDDTVTVGLGSDSTLPTLKVKTGGSAITYTFKTEAGDYTSFAKKSTSGNYDLYELSAADNVTDYGLIDAEFCDATTYPFVMFSDGEFLGAYETWKLATEAIGTVLENKTSSDVVVLLRRDYTNTDDAANGGALGKANGRLTVDLGGKIFTRAKNIFDMWHYAGNEKDVNIEIKNGTMRTTGGPFFAFQINGTQAYAKDKKFNVTANGVTFGYAANATSNSGGAFLTVWSNTTSMTQTLGSVADVTFNNCIFDLKTNAPSVDSASKQVIFNLKDDKSNNNVDINMTINGGSIISNDLSGLTLYQVNKPTDGAAGTGGSDTVTFGKYNGKYTTLTTPTTAKDFGHYTGAITTPEGTRYFVEVLDDGTNSHYELLPMSFGNKSASITAKYLSAYDYPFFVFLGDTFKSANTSWRGAVDAAESWVDAEGEENLVATIITRRNYDINRYKADGTTNLNGGTNVNQVRGKVVVELNGYTLNNIDTYLLDVNVNYNTSAVLGYLSRFEVRNGTLKNSRTNTIPLIGLQHSNTTAADDTKEFEFKFTNVTFAFGAGSGGRWLDDFTGKTGDGIIASYIFDGCTLDFTNAPSGATAFRLAEGNGKMPSAVKINGGRIIADDISKYTVFSGDSTDTITFNKYNGEYTALTQNASAALPSDPINSDSAKRGLSFKNDSDTALTFGKESVDGTNAVYRLGEPVFIKYGTVPFAYANPEFYPFLVFSASGEFWGADDTFLDTVANYDNEGIMHTAKDKLSVNVWNGTSYGDSPLTAVVLMRANYTMAANETYNNLAQILGEVKVDLDGHTLTADKSRVIFPTSVKPWGTRGVFPTTITLKGGAVEIFDAPIINFEPWTGDTTRPNDFLAGKLFTYNFDGVTVKVLGSASTVAAKYSQHNDNDGKAIANTFVNFTDSVIDLSDSTASAISIVSTGNGYCHTTSTFLGGEIIGKSGFEVVSDGADTAGRFTFGKGTDGDLTVLRLGSGKVPAEEFDSSLGKLVFVAKDGAYELKPVAALALNVKSSISLYSDLYLNIFVTKIDSLASFTVAGKAYSGETLAALTTRVIDDVTYYVVSVPLAARSALEDVSVIATLALEDGSTLDGDYNLNVVGYAKKILATSASENEKTLVRDILSYLRAAYAYFGTENAERLAETDLILGAGYDETNAPAFATPAVKPALGSGTEGATLVLDATPRMRFYLADGVNADDFVFKQNGYTVPHTQGSDNIGEYIEVTTYAYGMAGVVSYTVKGTDMAGEFNVKAYYDYVSGSEYTDTDKAALATLVERFQRYAESALAYRNEALAGQ